MDDKSYKYVVDSIRGPSPTLERPILYRSPQSDIIKDVTEEELMGALIRHCKTSAEQLRALK